MSYKWRPSQKAKREFAKKMSEIEEYCAKNGISASSSMDSYYFDVNGQSYRVSNHSIESSNKRAYDSLGNKIRQEYHNGKRNDWVIYIHASKTRIIEIHQALLQGKKLDGFGNEIE